MFKDSEEDLPEEYYLATPPKVDENYMANLKQKKAGGNDISYRECPGIEEK